MPQAHLRESEAARLRGVYYTPRALAEQMVGAAFDSLAEQGCPHPSVLDPACGDGVFLVAAAKRMLGDRADLSSRFEVLSSIFGIELDRDAVEAARRALVDALFPRPMGRVRAEAIADENLCCADALGDLETHPALARVIRRGGFELVAGNPPYLRELGHGGHLAGVTEKIAARRRARLDLQCYFLHRGLELTRTGGLLTFVMSAYWTRSSSARDLRRTIAEGAHVEEIFDLGKLPVFAGVRGRHLWLRIRRAKSEAPTRIRCVPDHATGDPLPYLIKGHAEVRSHAKPATRLFTRSGLDLGPPEDALVERLESHSRLDRFGLVRQGIADNPGAITRRLAARFGGPYRVGDGVFALDRDEIGLLALDPSEQAVLRPYHRPIDIRPNEIAPATRFLLYSTPRTWPELDRFPRLRDHLLRFRPIMEARRETKLGRIRWWHLHWPRDEALLDAPKIVAPQMAGRPTFAASFVPTYVPFSVNFFVPHAATREHLGYLSALLNSSLLSRWFHRRAKPRGAGLDISCAVLASAPIRRIDFDDPRDRRLHGELVEIAGSDEAEIEKRVAALYGVETDRVDPAYDRSMILYRK